MRVVALGNPNASDDGAVLCAVSALDGLAEVVTAGRPGVGLLDLLDPTRPTVLADVVQSGAPPGTIFRLSLAEVESAAAHRGQLSSHGFGPSETLKLGRVLGRRLPPGFFVGIEGVRFSPGGELSPPVASAMSALAAALEEAVRSAGALGAAPSAAREE